MKIMLGMLFCTKIKNGCQYGSRFFVAYQLGTHLSILTFFNKNN